MQDSAVVYEGKPLSQAERVVDTFIAPSKTFQDIRRSASWWLPIILVSIVGIVFSYVILHKIGLAALVDGVIHTNASLGDKIAGASPADAARIRASIEMQFRFMYVAPVFIVVVGLIVSGLFLATANFVFAGRAKYSQMLAVWFYGALPLIFVSLLSIVLIYAGVLSSDNFNIKNPAATNVGYFLQGGSSPAWLVTLLSSVDVFAIWAAVLLTMGVSIVAGIKRSSAAIVVFGWWALYVIGQTAIAMVTG